MTGDIVPVLTFFFSAFALAIVMVRGLDFLLGLVR